MKPSPITISTPPAWVPPTDEDARKKAAGGAPMPYASRSEERRAIISALELLSDRLYRRPLWKHGDHLRKTIAFLALELKTSVDEAAI